MAIGNLRLYKGYGYQSGFSAVRLRTLEENLNIQTPSRRTDGIYNAISTRTAFAPFSRL